MLKSSQVSKKVLDSYYANLDTQQNLGTTNESSTRRAFANLLETLAKKVGWMLTEEYRLADKKRLIDGALLDEFRLPRGYWEAKDTKDDLSKEIAKKVKLNYPLKNTIFEDTRRAVLYQDDIVVMEVDLSDRKELTKLLACFFSYSEALVEEFHTAVDTFEKQIPDLAAALIEIIRKEQKSNKEFQKALTIFHTLCIQSLHPSISLEVIIEMLVQHLLTERIFRTVFNNPDFTNRNVIAMEIEKVIHALTSHSFSRGIFLKKLDYFYVAIERAAATISDFSEKQGFLNTIYERFFQSFSRKQADTHGIVYTPQEIVDFMCASVEAVLKKEFDLSLSSKGVSILDPCVGTGNFIVNILRRINPRELEHKYQHELFCNEVMLLPYYIASLNIEHAYFEKTNQYEVFPGISFADTLDLAEERQGVMFTLENTTRIERQKEAEIMVIVGNPPYNVGQVNENDNNKNRLYEEVDHRIRETYAKDSRAKLKTKLYDMYVRFFRWAVDRLGGHDGIICFVSNNGFLEGTAFDGFRKHLINDFTHIYHLDLGGNARREEGGNVFDIRVGVGITLLVRKTKIKEHKLFYYRVPDIWHKDEKLSFLAAQREISGIKWETLQRDEPHHWLRKGLQSEFSNFLPIGIKGTKGKKEREEQSLFQIFSLGVSTNRDRIVYDFNKTTLVKRIETFIEEYNSEVFRWSRAGKPEDVDNFVRYEKVKWSYFLKQSLKRELYADFNYNKIRLVQYRPFTKKYLYYGKPFVDAPGLYSRIFPTPATETENVVIIISDIAHRAPFSALVSNVIPDLHTLAVVDGFQCFPFYTYDEDGTNRRENITDWALEQFRNHCADTSITKWDIFYYVYAVLHSTVYRARYAQNLRRDLPRIPPPSSLPHFTRLAAIGRQLADLHLNYEQVEEYSLDWEINPDVPWSLKVEQMTLSEDKTELKVNEMLTIKNIPAACFEYQLGNRSALEWVIDQYRLRYDEQNDILNDPNREDDSEYIARLVGRVVQVSMETMRLAGEIGEL